jgi:hypothetical protein
VFCWLDSDRLAFLACDRGAAGLYVCPHKTCSRHTHHFPRPGKERTGFDWTDGRTVVQVGSPERPGELSFLAGLLPAASKPTTDPGLRVRAWWVRAI